MGKGFAILILIDSNFIVKNKIRTKMEIKSKI